jgi:hypothetical protein
MSSVLEQLMQLAEVPSQDAGPWLASAENGIEFLKEHLFSDTAVLYASLNAVMIHAVLVPLKHLDPVDHQKLSREFISPDDSWIIEHASGGGQPDRVYLAPPLRRLGEPFDEGEKLVFKRSFIARQGDTVHRNQSEVGSRPRSPFHR